LIVPVYDMYELPRDKNVHYILAYEMERCGLLSVEEKVFVNAVGYLWNEYKREACQQDDPEL